MNSNDNNEEFDYLYALYRSAQAGKGPLMSKRQLRDFISAWNDQLKIKNNTNYPLDLDIYESPSIGSFCQYLKNYKEFN